MSTRANIIIKDGVKNVYLYQHHDGYICGGLGDALTLVCPHYFNKGYSVEEIVKRLVKEQHSHKLFVSPLSEFNIKPTSGIHGDIEFLYEIDIRNKVLLGYERTDWDIYPNEYKRWKVENLIEELLKY